MSGDKVVALRAVGQPRRPKLAPLQDPDSKAYQVRAFLRGVQLMEGFELVDARAEGREMLDDFLLKLATEGDGAWLALTPGQIASVLTYLSCIRPTDEAREDSRTILDGGAEACGYGIVLEWLSQEVDELEPSDEDSE